MLDRNKLENILFKIVEYGVYVALFSPLIVAKSYFFLFVSPKTIFFRIIVDIIFIAYIVLAVSNPKYRPKITPLTIAIAAFLAILFLTAVLGVNFEKSFWSVFERMTGLLTFLHLFAFYLILTACFQERKHWERILTVSISVAVLISFNALLSNDPLTRGGSTLGNSSFFMSYLLFNIFFAGIMLVWKKGPWRVPFGMALLLFLLLLFFNPVTITKGAVSSFLIGAVLFATGLLFFSGNKLLKRAALVFLVLAVFLGVFIVKNFHFQDRPFNLLKIPDRSRQIVWTIGWEAWQERFWLGWGWENFNVPFAKYYNSELPVTGDAWYDRVHNIILDTGVSSGIIGLLSYLSIFGIAMFALFKQIINLTRKDLVKSFHMEVLVALALITLLFVYFLQNFWVFDMISSYIMFFATLALIGFLVYTKDKQNQMRLVPLPAFSGGLLIILTIFALFYGNIQPARVSKEIINGLAYGVEQSIAAFQKAMNLSPIAQFEVPERFSARLNELTFKPDQSPQAILAGFESAEQEFEKVVSENLKDTRMMMFLARHFNNFFRITGREEKLALAEGVLREAIELSSGNQQLYWELAQTKLYQQEFEEALALAEKAIDMEPRLLDSHLIAIQIAKIMGNDELVRQKINEAISINPEWEPRLKEILERP